jgi:hypothetical protein
MREIWTPSAISDRPPVASSVDELFAGVAGTVDAVGPMDKHADSLSGSSFERAVIDGRSYIVKRIGYDIDWLARALGDRDCFALTLRRTGLLQALPDTIDHSIVGVAHDRATGIVSLLMHDIAEWLLPTGSRALPFDQHRRFLAHMADMHASFWDFPGVPGLLDARARYMALTPATGEREAAEGRSDPVPRALPVGWAALREAAPKAHDLALALASDPTPLVAALAETPVTLIHGDWKAGNLGAHPDGRTILLDWGWPGRAAPLADLAWYVAVNCDRLPESKQDTIAAYRTALEAQSIDTSDWWQRQFDLALVGGFLQLGWSKAGDPNELAWWVDRIVPTARDLMR